MLSSSCLWTCSQSPDRKPCIVHSGVLADQPVSCQCCVLSIQSCACRSVKSTVRVLFLWSSCFLILMHSFLRWHQCQTFELRYLSWSWPSCLVYILVFDCAIRPVNQSIREWDGPCWPLTVWLLVVATQGWALAKLRPSVTICVFSLSLWNNPSKSYFCALSQQDQRYWANSYVVFQDGWVNLFLFGKYGDFCSNVGGRHLPWRPSCHGMQLSAAWIISDCQPWPMFDLYSALLSRSFSSQHILAAANLESFQAATANPWYSHNISQALRPRWTSPDWMWSYIFQSLSI